MKSILIDADILVAIAKENDTNHEKALEISQRIKNFNLYITPFTIPEATTVISYKVGQKEAKDFLKEARAKKLTEVLITKELTDNADEIFLSQNKKGTSWIDCLNAAALKLYGIDAIFSFDRFYKQQKLPVLN
jgi:predicted nucleic acid-binding protein